jgi:hypothetical protein
MKKAFLLFALCAGMALTATAQKSADKVTVKSVDTASPTFDFIYEGEDGDGAVRIEIHDRQHQFTGMSNKRLNTRANGGDPTNYQIKLVNIPELGPLAFRQAESLEEAKAAVDGVTVIMVRYLDLLEAARIKYN